VLLERLLGLTFQGETRDADGMVWGDVEIKNLTTDVRVDLMQQIYTNRKGSSQYWYIWAEHGKFTYVFSDIYFYNEWSPSISSQDHSPSNLSDSDIHKFGVGIIGQTFDSVGLYVSENAQGFFKKDTGRGDLEFGKWTWLSCFK